MKVFLSWSGTRSKAVAGALRAWLPDVIQSLEPWMSSDDIESGARWNTDLASALQGTHVGIICLTKSNLQAPWIHFEAGALAKALNSSRVCTYLNQVRPADLREPLSQFQATNSDRQGTLKLVHALNSSLGDQARPQAQIEKAFERWWPDLEAALKNIPDDDGHRTHRDQRELLEEILLIVRDVGRPSFFRRSGENESPLLRDIVLGRDVLSFSQAFSNTAIVCRDDMGEWSHNRLAEGDPLDGAWSSRWNGGTAGNEWRVGHAAITVTGRYTVATYRDSEGYRRTYVLIAERLDDARLCGRYFSLDKPFESSPWVGVIVNDSRIDGRWEQGRWDFRRPR